MKTVQVSRRSASYRRRLLAAGALSAVVALSHVDSAAAKVTCAVDTYYNGAPFPTNDDCDPCPTGTSAAVAPNPISSPGPTYCEGILAGYYGTIGVTGASTGKHAVVAQCPSGWTSTAIATGGPTTIADCFKAASGITLDTTMYVKSGDPTNVYYCPTGTVNTANAVTGTVSFCSSLKPGYAGTTTGTTGSHASVSGCASGYYIATTADFAAQSSNSDASGLVCTEVPANKYFTTTTSNPLQVTSVETPSACPSDSNSQAGSTAQSDCKCDAGYKATNSNTCTACPTGTDWTTAPSVGTTATLCEGVKTGFAGSPGSGTDATITGCASGYYISNPADTAGSANTNANGLACTEVQAGKYYTTATLGLTVSSPESPNACPYAGTSAAGSTAITDCTPDCSTTNQNSGAEALAGTCVCSAGTYSSGTVGSGKPDDASNSDAAAAQDGCTKCSTTFSGATAAGITSARSSTDKTACETAPGYIITSAVGAADGSITVAKAAAGKYAAGGTSLVTANAATSGTAAETASTCAANTYSAAGAASCTACPTGQTSAAGASACAASPTADSAGASTPIAVALAAAAAVPLLL